METVANSHITIDDAGIARIEGSRMKVIHVVKEMLARNASAGQLHEVFPHISLSQLHGALAYYYDHKAQFDAQIAQESREFDEARAADQQNPLRNKIINHGRRP